MSLWEIRFNRTGESYVRCYVWCKNEDEARRMAIVQAVGERPKESLTIDSCYLCFSADAGPFCTEISDCGWETPAVT